MQIKETNLVNLRRTLYLTIMSSVDFEEAGHKLLKIKLKTIHNLLIFPMQMELCIILLECCSQERTYLRYYGLLGQCFCMINKVYQENFDKCFVHQYSMIHQLETNKLRNVVKFFAHLLGTFALTWYVLAYIHLIEEDTTSSSRILIKILFQSFDTFTRFTCEIFMKFNLYMEQYNKFCVIFRYRNCLYNYLNCIQTFLLLLLLKGCIET
ncbi:hypothetical protein UlMin_012713 [Ulmus minor]